MTNYINTNYTNSSLLRRGDIVRVRLLSDTATAELATIVNSGSSLDNYKLKLGRREIGKIGEIRLIEKFNNYIHWFSIYDEATSMTQGMYRAEELELIKEFKQKDKLLLWLSE